MDWHPYQRRFLAAVDDPRYRTVAASWPRGAGKTTCAGYIVARALSPGDPLHVPGGEVVLFAGSIEQCRLTYRQALGFLEARIGDYRTVDSATRVAITHKATGTRLKAVGSNPKTSLGLVGVPLAILDEPAALHTVGGTALWDSVRTAQGKVGSPLKAILTGTIAPSAPGSWWPQLVERGTVGSTWVGALQGRADRWDSWREVLRVNPLARHHPEFAAVLREERDAARADSRLAGAFKSFRLNLPTGDESTMLLNVADWERACSRPVPERAGRPIVGLDLGAGRAWSAAVAVWRSGLTAALAVAPGLPTLSAQEKRDRAPAGSYCRLAESGALRVAAGLRVQPPAELVRAVEAAWGRPEAVVCDRFRLGELQDAAPGWRIVPRVVRWSEAAADIRAVRKMAADGPLAVAEPSRGLLTASLAAALVASDDAGNVRLVKRGTNNQARDDVAAALVLACGALSRAPAPRRVRSAVAG
ncbi:MAG: hypothetical protein OXF93_02160 [Acidobacteria bacterium]|nr:hypothetical protein [Acidobacteriota bacterium]